MSIQSNPLSVISKAVGETVANETGIEIATLNASQTLIKAEGKINESVNSASDDLSSWESTLKILNEVMIPLTVVAMATGVGGAVLGAAEIAEAGTMAGQAVRAVTLGTQFVETASYVGNAGVTGWRIYVEQKIAGAKKDVSLDQTAASSLFKTINANGSLVKETLETEQALGNGATEFMRQMTHETTSFKG